MHRNERFTKHQKYTTREVKRKTTEVWSIGERLYKDKFKVKSQMFDTLVAPIGLYAAEVTGYECVEDYDVVRRRYAK